MTAANTLTLDRTDSRSVNLDSLPYRPEIDGLRALAVLPVIFFHAGFEFFQGGFVGVDIFFVISGYLITTIIISSQETRTFSLANFYERRARRILPALFFVMIVCLPFAWFLMLPDDLENFGQSLFATTLFTNNVLLWLTSGYWGLANEFKPLLHTWSLSIEEQYYIIFPITMILLLRFCKNMRHIIIFICFLASLVMAHFGSKFLPNATFFLLPTRAWELLLGALVALQLAYPPRSFGSLSHRLQKKLNQLLSLCGLTLIVFAVLIFNDSTPFPSFYALLPTCGTALVILYSGPGTFCHVLLSNKALVGLGLVSYSAYLWHQPVFAFLRLNSLEPPGPLVFLGAIVGIILISILSWKFIETPFRSQDAISRRVLVTTSFLSAIALSSVGIAIHLNSGFVSLWGELHDEMEAGGRRLNAIYNELPYKYADRDFVDIGKNNVLIIGNSLARDFINSGLENNYFSTSEISYIPNFPDCFKSVELDGHVYRRVSGSDYVIFGSGVKLECWEENFRELKNIGVKHIIVIGVKNFGWNLNAVMRLPVNERNRYKARVVGEALDINLAHRAALPSTNFVDLLDMIMDEDLRVPVFTDDGKLISQDTTHLTKAGARYMGKVLFQHPLLVALQ